MSTYTTVSTFTRAIGTAESNLWYLVYYNSTQYIIIPEAVEDDFQVGDYLTIAANSAGMAGMGNLGSIATTQVEITDVGAAGTLFSEMSGFYAAFAPPAGFDEHTYGAPSWLNSYYGIANRAGIESSPEGVATFERLSGDGNDADTGYSLPEYGVPTFVDRAWGNLPMQPNDERAADGEGTVVVVEPNAVGNYGWSGFSVFRSEQLDPALGDHVVAVTGYNGFPNFAGGGATGSTGPVGPTGLVLTLSENGSNSLFLDPYGNPAPMHAFSISYADMSGQGWTIGLDFSVTNADIAANPLLADLKAAGLALTAAPMFQYDGMYSTTFLQQQDAWVRANAGAALPELNLQFSLRASTMSNGYTPSSLYTVATSYDFPIGFRQFENSKVTLALNTASTNTYFGVSSAYGNNPIIVSDNGSRTSFRVYVTVYSSGVFGVFQDAYGNVPLDQYGNPLTDTALLGNLVDNLSINNQQFQTANIRAGAGTLTLS